MWPKENGHKLFHRWGVCPFLESGQALSSSLGFHVERHSAKLPSWRVKLPWASRSGQSQLKPRKDPVQASQSRQTAGPSPAWIPNPQNHERYKRVIFFLIFDFYLFIYFFQGVIVLKPQNFVEACQAGIDNQMCVGVAVSNPVGILTYS